MHLREYLERHGDESVAKAMRIRGFPEITAGRVSRWRLGYRYPQARMIPALLEVCGGMVSIDEIHAPYEPRK